MTSITIYLIYGDYIKLVTTLFNNRLMTCISVKEEEGWYWLRGQAMNKNVKIIKGVVESQNIDKIENILHADGYDAAITEVNQMPSRSNLFTDWYYAHR